MQLEMEMEMTQLRILIIEDDANTLQGLQELLLHEGFRVEGAETGKSAKKLFFNQTFDVVLCDYRLPDTDGLQLCSEMLIAKPELEIMMFTAISNIEIQHTAKQLGVRKVFAKPLSLDQLFSELENVKIDLQKTANLTQA